MAIESRLDGLFPPMTRRRFARTIPGVAAALSSSGSAAFPTDTSGRVLFAFDDRALPLQHGLRLRLSGYRNMVEKPSNRVLPAGQRGSPDADGALYYGSVLEIGDQLWMWYLGQGDRDGRRHLRVCLATSKDGRQWERPALGLVGYGGSRRNNLVEIRGVTEPVTACIVLHEPEEPDPARRFKMVFESSKYRNRIAVAFSPDGIRWTESSRNPCGPRLEPSGAVKWGKAWYVNGQGGKHWAGGETDARMLVTHVSYDFETWSQSSCLGFRRDPIPPRPVTRTGFHDGEQVHLGASLWNRGNVIVGIYGQWHGHPSNDRRWVAMDLGLVISHDALHYREPIPDFRIVEAAEAVTWLPPNAAPWERASALMQGQGFVNRGDETLFWYSIWGMPAQGVRLATWARDRLGFLQPYLGPRDTPHLISAPVAAGSHPVAVSLNVVGLSEQAQVKVGILDEQLRPLAGYGASECTGPKQSGLRERVTWRSRDSVPPAGPIRIRVEFTGSRPEDIQLYAVYVEPS